MYGNILLKVLLILNVHASLQCPNSASEDEKAAYKSGETIEENVPVTLERIKLKLKESNVFDEETTELTDVERKELRKLFETVEIMTTSRNRQPQSVQNLFSSIRMLERVIKKQLKENQISETLAAKFRWENLSARAIREKPMYHYDQNTRMRMFTPE